MNQTTTRTYFVAPDGSVWRSRQAYLEYMHGK